jgi:hypothetical protein
MPLFPAANNTVEIDRGRVKLQLHITVAMYAFPLNIIAEEAPVSGRRLALKKHRERIIEYFTLRLSVSHTLLTRDFVSECSGEGFGNV